MPRINVENCIQVLFQVETEFVAIINKLTYVSMGESCIAEEGPLGSDVFHSLLPLYAIIAIQ